MSEIKGVEVLGNGVFCIKTTPPQSSMIQELKETLSEFLKANPTLEVLGITSLQTGYGVTKELLVVTRPRSTVFPTE